MTGHRGNVKSSRLFYLIVALLLGFGGAVVIPQLRGTRSVSRTANCDNIYVSLNGRVANDLDSVLNGSTTACGTTGGPDAVIRCALEKNRRERNPNNSGEAAYAWIEEIESNASSCRVGLSATSTNGVRFSQFVKPNSETSRTFSVTID